MEQPKVSIIVPVYKTEKYLDRCIKSLKDQTLKDIEIILVDDGSPDSCPMLCDNAAKEDERIRVVHKENQGLGMARNSGIDAASGKYIGFVDSDDYVTENMFEELYLAAEKYGAQLVISGITFVGGNMFGKESEYIENIFFERDTVFETENHIKDLMLGVMGALPHEKRDSRYGMSVCKNIYLRQSVLDNNIRFLSEREVLSEDAIFMIDYIKCIDKAVGVQGAYYLYCRNGDSLSKSYNSERLNKSLIFMDELEKRIGQLIPYENYIIYLDRLAQGFGRVLCSQEIMHGVENKISWCVLRKKLKRICTADRIAGALKKYQWYKLPVKQGIFAFLMKHKMYLLQKLFVIMRSK